MSDEARILDVAGISVRFGGVQALSDVTLHADAGQVTGLIGPNGAGKTTLFNVITGLEHPNGGTVGIAGNDVTRMSPHRRARMGLARTFQRLEIFGSLSAYGNVLAAAEFHKAWARDKSNPAQVAGEILERVGLSDVASERVDALPTGTARLVEVGRALATNPRLLLLDEPGSGLSHDETQTLGDLLLELVSDGKAILLVEHDVELVMRVSSFIHVLDFGRIIAAGTPAEVQRNRDVQAAYLGAEMPDAEAS
jgi:branched-chain amino acid transport system ATP-binding protein